jgi:hypothetical protein
MKLHPTDTCLLQTLCRLRFATREQLSYWCGRHPARVSHRLLNLQKLGLVSSEEYNRPTIWTVKPRAAALMQTTLPSGKRHSSWSAMSHACHRNEVEMLLNAKEESAGFRFLLELPFFWKRGLNPAFGEHSGEDKEKRAYLVLLDDYLMKPDRIGRTWERAHHPPRKYFSGNRAWSWSKIVNHFIVATTDEFRAERHMAWTLRHSVPAQVITIKSLWN